MIIIGFISMFLLNSCTKEETKDDNYSKVEDLLRSYNIKNYKIDKSIINSNSFDFEKFKSSFEEKELRSKNQLKISVLLLATSIVSQLGSSNLSGSDVNMGSGGGYSCAASYGSETYYFYRAPGSSGSYSINNTARFSSWTTSNCFYNAQTNTYTFIGYDTYNIPALGITWDHDYQITVRRVGNTCYFTRTGLID